VSNPVQALIFVAMFLVIQQIEGNMIYPRVVGTSIGLSGMWVLLAVAVGGSVFGIAGMFLMIPVASVLFTLLKEFANKRLADRNIAPDKLAPQPLEFRSNFSEKISTRKSKKEKANKDKTPKE
jgi:predicted PurR-regulated permease PerM